MVEQLVTDNEIKATKELKVADLATSVNKKVAVFVSNINALSSADESQAFFDKNGHQIAEFLEAASTAIGANLGPGYTNLSLDNFLDATLDKVIIYSAITALDESIRANMDKYQRRLAVSEVSDAMLKIDIQFKAAGDTNTEKALGLFKLSDDGTKVELSDVLAKKFNAREKAMSEDQIPVKERKDPLAKVIDYISELENRFSTVDKIKAELIEVRSYKRASENFNEFLTRMEGADFDSVAREKLEQGIKCLDDLLKTKKGREEISAHRNKLLDSLVKSFDNKGKEPTEAEVSDRHIIPNRKFFVEFYCVKRLKKFFKENTNIDDYQRDSSIKRVDDVFLPLYNISYDAFASLFKVLDHKQQKGELGKRGKKIVENIKEVAKIEVDIQELIEYAGLRGKRFDLDQVTILVIENNTWREQAGRVEIDDSFGSEKTRNRDEPLNVEVAFHNLTDFEDYVNSELAKFEYGEKQTEAGFEAISKFVSFLVENTFHTNVTIAESAKINLVFLTKGLVRRIHPSKITGLLVDSKSRAALGKTQSELADLGLVFKFGKVKTYNDYTETHSNTQSLADFVNNIVIDYSNLQRNLGIDTNTAFNPVGNTETAARAYLEGFFRTPGGRSGVFEASRNAQESLVNKLRYLYGESLIDRETLVLQNKKYELNNYVANSARDIVWEVMKQSILFNRNRNDSAKTIPQNDEKFVKDSDYYFALETKPFATTTEKLAIIASGKQEFEFLKGERLANLVNLLLGVVVNKEVVNVVTTTMSYTVPNTDGESPISPFVSLVSFLQQTGVHYPSNTEYAKDKKRIYQIEPGEKPTLPLNREHFLFDVMLLYSVFVKLENLDEKTLANETPYVWVPSEFRTPEVPNSPLLSRLKNYLFVLGFTSPVTGADAEKSTAAKIIKQARVVQDDTSIAQFVNIGLNPAEGNNYLPTWFLGLSAFFNSDENRGEGVGFDRTNQAASPFSEVRKITVNELLGVAAEYYQSGETSRLYRLILPPDASSRRDLESKDMELLDKKFGLNHSSTLYHAIKFISGWRKLLDKNFDTGKGVFKKDGTYPSPSVEWGRFVTSNLLRKLGTTKKIIVDAITAEGMKAWNGFRNGVKALASTQQKGHVDLAEAPTDAAAWEIFLQVGFDKYAEKEKKSKTEIVEAAIEHPATSIMEGGVGLRIREFLAYGISPRRYDALVNLTDPKFIDRNFWADRAEAILYQKIKEAKEQATFKAKDWKDRIQRFNKDVLEKLKVFSLFSSTLASELSRTYFEFSAFMRFDEHLYRTEIYPPNKISRTVYANGKPFIINEEETNDMMLSIPEAYFANFRSLLSPKESNIVLGALQRLCEVDDDLGFVLDRSLGNDNLVLYVGQREALSRRGHRSLSTFAPETRGSFFIADDDFRAQRNPNKTKVDGSIQITIDPWNAMRLQMALVDRLFNDQFNRLTNYSSDSSYDRDQLVKDISDLHHIIGNFNVDNAAIPISNANDNQRTTLHGKLSFHDFYQVIEKEGDIDRGLTMNSLTRKIMLMSLFASVGPIAEIGFRNGNILFDSVPAARNLKVSLPIKILPLIYGNPTSPFRETRDGVESWVDYFKLNLGIVPKEGLYWNPLKPDGSKKNVDSAEDMAMQNVKPLENSFDLDILINDIFENQEFFFAKYPEFFGKSGNEITFTARLPHFEPFLQALCGDYYAGKDTDKEGEIATGIFGSANKNIVPPLIAIASEPNKLRAFNNAQNDMEGEKGIAPLLAFLVLMEATEKIVKNDEKSSESYAFRMGMSSVEALTRTTLISSKAGLHEVVHNMEIMVQHQEFLTAFSERLINRINEGGETLAKNVKPVSGFSKAMSGLGSGIVKAFADILPSSPAGLGVAIRTGALAGIAMGVVRTIGSPVIQGVGGIAPHIADLGSVPLLRAGIVLATGLGTNWGVFKSFAAAGACAAADIASLTNPEFSPIISAIVYPLVNYFMYERAGFGRIKSGFAATMPFWNKIPLLDVTGIGGLGFGALANPVSLALIMGGIYENRVFPWIKNVMASDSWLLKQEFFSKLPGFKGIFELKRKVDKFTFTDVFTQDDVAAKLIIDTAKGYLKPKWWVKHGYSLPLTLGDAIFQRVFGFEFQGLPDLLVRARNRIVNRPEVKLVHSSKANFILEPTQLLKINIKIFKKEFPIFKGIPFRGLRTPEILNYNVGINTNRNEESRIIREQASRAIHLFTVGAFVKEILYPWFGIDKIKDRDKSVAANTASEIAKDREKEKKRGY